MRSIVVANACRLSGARREIVTDAERWASMFKRDQQRALSEHCAMPEFRSLAYYRMREAGGLGRYLSAILRRVIPGERTLHIVTPKLGAGTQFVHGYATIVLAERVGEDCQIFQCVTVGDSPRTHGLPRIGNRVWIFPGAVVSGPISIGDDAVIGANSVVTCDVPAGEVWAGAPARRIGLSADLEHGKLQDEGQAAAR